MKQELTYREVDDSIENVWSVLYATGYLTGKHVEQEDADIFRLWIPNGEIRKLFYELVEDWFREVTRSDTVKDQPLLRGVSGGGYGNDPGDAWGLPVGFHQCERYSSAQEHEGKFLSRDAAWAPAKSG